MASRRDQLHSYQFLLQRVISALVMRETDPAQAPLRRGTGAVFAGIMIAVIMAAGFGVYGIFTKIGSGDWKGDGSVVVEKETGAAYVFREGTLHPMLNYTSALLASGRQPPATFRVPHASLSEVPHGITLGIPNAPNSLPDRKQVIGAPWTLCSVPGRDEANRAVTTTVLVLARPLSGGRTLDDSGLLVRDPRGPAMYLVWHSHRYAVTASETVIPSLFGATTAVDVGAAWVNGLPAGPDIGPIKPDKAGENSAVVTGRRNGDLLVAKVGTGNQYYLVFDDGLASITEFQKAIVAGQGGATEKSITVAEANNFRKSAKLVPPASGDVQLPPAAPRLAQPQPEDRICASSDDPRSAPVVSTGGSFPGVGDGTPTGSTSADGTSYADRVAVPAGRIAVVRALASPTATTGAYSLVTDVGVRYPLAAESVLPILGYAAQDAVAMPASLVNRIPVGPTLDPLAAVRPAEVGARTGSR